MQQKIDIENIKQKIFEKLEPSGWGKIFKSFIYSSDFENILKKLVSETKEGKRFTPSLKDMFKAFEECPYDKLKVVMVGQDPYPYLGIADGIAFSCSKNENIQPSLEQIFNEINNTVYTSENQKLDPNLKRWSNQGVLMLNTALTTNVGKTGTHYKIWQPFIAYLFDYLTWHNNGLVYVYMGKVAQEWADCVNDNNYKFYLSHPASAAYTNTNWNSENVFNNINKIIKDNYNEIITW